MLLLGMIVAGWLGASLVQSVTDIDLSEPTDPVLCGPTLLRLGAAALQGCLVACYAWLVLRRPPSPGERRVPVVRAAGIGVVAVAFVWPVSTLAGWVAGTIHRRITGAAPETIAHDTLRQLMESPPDVWFALMTFSVVIIAPVIEEVQYRGLLQESLRRFGLGRWPAVLVTSAAFAAMHLSIADPHAVAALFVLSLGFGWAYERTGRLLAPIVMHIAFNAGNLLLARALL
jgi:membrane protease YdiL (CAAX protease family)